MPLCVSDPCKIESVLHVENKTKQKYSFPRVNSTTTMMKYSELLYYYCIKVLATKLLKVLFRYTVYCIMRLFSLLQHWLL